MVVWHNREGNKSSGMESGEKKCLGLVRELTSGRGSACGKGGAWRAARVGQWLSGSFLLLLSLSPSPLPPVLQLATLGLHLYGRARVTESSTKSSPAERSPGQWLGGVCKCLFPGWARLHIPGSPCAHLEVVFFARDSMAGAWEGGAQKSGAGRVN